MANGEKITSRGWGGTWRRARDRRPLHDAITTHQHHKALAHRANFFLSSPKLKCPYLGIHTHIATKYYRHHETIIALSWQVKKNIELILAMNFVYKSVYVNAAKGEESWGRAQTPRQSYRRAEQPHTNCALYINGTDHIASNPIELLSKPGNHPFLKARKALAASSISLPFLFFFYGLFPISFIRSQNVMGKWWPIKAFLLTRLRRIICVPLTPCTVVLCCSQTASGKTWLPSRTSIPLSNFPLQNKVSLLSGLLAANQNLPGQVKPGQVKSRQNTFAHRNMHPRGSQ